MGLTKRQTGAKRMWARRSKSVRDAIMKKVYGKNTPDSFRQMAEARRKLWEKSPRPTGTWVKAGQTAASKRVKNTKIELKVQAVLRAERVRFSLHVHLGFCVPDILIGSNVCVFVDGEHWHSKPSRKAHDRRIDKRLCRLGYEVVRLSEQNVRKNMDWCLDRILEAVIESSIQGRLAA